MGFSSPNALYFSLGAFLQRSEERLRSKGKYHRKVDRLDCFGIPCILKIECRRYTCAGCGRCFVPPLPGVRPGRHSSEPLREKIYCQRFAATFCDLKNHKVFDVVQGRSQSDLIGFLQTLRGRERVRVI